MRELKGLGAHNLNDERATALMGKKKLSGVISAYEIFRLENTYLPATYKLLWGVLKKS